MYSYPIVLPFNVIHKQILFSFLPPSRKTPSLKIQQNLFWDCHDTNVPYAKFYQDRFQIESVGR